MRAQSKSRETGAKTYVLADQGDAVRLPNLHALDEGVDDELAEAAALELGGHGQRVHADRLSALDVTHLAGTHGGLPVGGNAHLLVGDDLRVRGRGDDVGQEDALALAGALGLDGVREVESWEHADVLNLIGHDGLEDSQAQLGAGGQSVLDLCDMSEMQ